MHKVVRATKRKMGWNDWEYKKKIATPMQKSILPKSSACSRSTTSQYDLPAAEATLS
jgi:hypothetical protein